MEGRSSGEGKGPEMGARPGGGGGRTAGIRQEPLTRGHWKCSSKQNGGSGQGGNGGTWNLHGWRAGGMEEWGGVDRAGEYEQEMRCQKEGGTGGGLAEWWAG